MISRFVLSKVGVYWSPPHPPHLIYCNRPYDERQLNGRGERAQCAHYSTRLGVLDEATQGRPLCVRKATSVRENPQKLEGVFLLLVEWSRGILNPREERTLRMTMWLHRKQLPSLKRSILEQKSPRDVGMFVIALKPKTLLMEQIPFSSSTTSNFSPLSSPLTDRSERYQVKKGGETEFSLQLLTVMAGNARGVLIDRTDNAFCYLAQPVRSRGFGNTARVLWSRTYDNRTARRVVSAFGNVD